MTLRRTHGAHAPIRWGAFPAIHNIFSVYQKHIVEGKDEQSDSQAAEPP